MKAFGWIFILTVAFVVPRPTAAQTHTPASPAGRPATSDNPTPVSPTHVHISGEVAIGDLAPDFVLDASNARPLKLSSTRGDWIVLVFDERKESLRDLRDQVDTLRAFGARILGVAHEKSYALESWSQREKLPFLGLADPTGVIGSMYGLFDGVHSTMDPGFLLIDRDGVVRMALLGQRLPPDDITRLARFVIKGP